MLAALVHVTPDPTEKPFLWHSQARCASGLLLPSVTRNDFTRNAGGGSQSVAPMPGCVVACTSTAASWHWPSQHQTSWKGITILLLSDFFKHLQGFLWVLVSCRLQQVLSEH